uniref:RNA-directed DNA polymerase n=1 Tax=Strigamia maritima TaxID=126957 RepID=T1IZH5_STRMM
MMDFYLESDHLSLKWLFQQKEPKGRLARWVLALSEYKFTFLHCSGCKNRVAVALNRAPVDPPEALNADVCPLVDDTCFQIHRLFHHKIARFHCTNCQLDQQFQHHHLGRSPRPGPSGLQLPVVRPLTEVEREAEKIHDPPVEHPPFELLPSVQEIIQAQEEDEWSHEKINYITTQQLPDPIEAERIRKETIDYQLYKGLLCRFLFASTDNMLRRRQIYLPQFLRERYFRALHYPPLVGHLGIEKTLRRLKSRVHWPGMKTDVHTWIQVCKPCQRSKPEKRLPFGKMLPARP